MKNVVHIITKRKKKKETLRFGIDIVKHCNLRCRGCDHFSCIANEQYAKFETVEKDLNRIKEIFGERVEQINLLGGEPLLNRDIVKYCRFIRSMFPNTGISIITNGTLLLNQSEEFWECCRKCGVELKITKYPINFDYDRAVKLAKENEIKIYYQAHSDEQIKVMYCVPIDCEGKQTPAISYSICAKGNECVTLENGKLFTCTLIPNIEIFNQYFGKHLKVTADDYIDIYKVDDPDEILSALASEVPFCKYCNNLGYKTGIPWGITNGKISEWL
ncbi:radical SAM protein [Butyrivibrio sp. XPD2002]|uniref:radical SAM protein n=1 Tax=Butyrivibrio sp. XPD2002 TaxID=1280665 RepID=UPI0018C8E708|nr:radical SAM protein [Butyrivibrio sp. XPD2002]